jgi:hypothetical protein
MKKKSKSATINDEIRTEYDFAKMKLVGKGKYAKRYQAGTNIVALSPEVAKAFPTEQAVNEALRLLIKISDISHRPRHKKAI